MHKLASCILTGLLALCIALPVQAKQVPFKAISNPDFSKIVTIHVPDGWKHRNAEGTMELTPPKGEGAVCVDVFHLDGRTPQQMATLLADGKTPEKYADREDAWQWTTDPAYGVWSNFFVGSAKDDVYVHFSWRDVDESVIMTILSKSVMAGAPVSVEALQGKGANIALPVQAQERTYSYRSEGAVGTLKLGTKDNDGKYPISIQTTSESNMRMCEFDGNCVRTDSGLTCDNPESVVPELRLTIQELKNGELEVSVNLPEFKVCGMGPGIAGRYVPKRK